MLTIYLKGGQSSDSIQSKRLRKKDSSLCGVQRLKHIKLIIYRRKDAYNVTTRWATIEWRYVSYVSRSFITSAKKAGTRAEAENNLLDYTWVAMLRIF